MENKNYNVQERMNEDYMNTAKKLVSAWVEKKIAGRNLALANTIKYIRQVQIAIISDYVMEVLVSYGLGESLSLSDCLDNNLLAEAFYQVIDTLNIDIGRLRTIEREQIDFAMKHELGNSFSRRK